MIGIIDYKAGNGPSVLNAMNKLNLEAKLVSTPEELSNVDGIILPGVGSAFATMDSLKELGLIEALNKRVLEEKTPFIGVCVGLQVLFEHSEEGDCDCMGWLKGQVKKFSSDLVRVPQIGWNEVKFSHNDPILEGLDDSGYFYFVNSYHIVPSNPENILAMTNYGIDFCSMIKQDNIYATQFHIEKSGIVGLKILENFNKIAMGRA